MEVFDGIEMSDSTLLGSRVTGALIDLTQVVFTSTGPNMIIQMKTDHSNTGTGFKVEYAAGTRFYI